MTAFTIGSLVHVRGRDWVVLPGSDPAAQMLLLRPLGGSDDEVAGIHTGLEPPQEARFEPPDPRGELGNYRSCTLLREATRLGFRSTAGPFRCLGYIAVDPRPYQLVPLLMAMKLDPVRLLIADDVGIGKTIEACLIAGEMIARGEIQRMAVLCPPHLAEQWQRALQEQFHIDAELLLAGTVGRLERGCELGQSVFARYPHLVVSLDFIKSDSRRNQLLAACPDLLIVDEAHGCTSGGPNRGQQQRHALLRDLVKKHPKLHLLLVTATPHSGKPEQFRSLLELLGPELAKLPDELGGKENEKNRRELARFLVQRRRGDLKAYLDELTPFPTREELDVKYSLTEPFEAFLDDVLEFCQERVSLLEGDSVDGKTRTRQRVRWWATLALLRAVSSSPAAAMATLQARAAAVTAQNEEEADEAGRRVVMDESDEGDEAIDANPGTSVDEAAGSPEQIKLQKLAATAERLHGQSKDPKLKALIKIVAELDKEGYRPIVFCRFIATAKYVAEELGAARELKGMRVDAVTGALAPEEREARIELLGKEKRRVLVCTDCLSEGVNLQHQFDAVVHYDLSWSITRHEQREGRVDRYGQPKAVVKAYTFYGKNHPIDGLVLNVLLKKHQKIRKALGVALPVPIDEADLLHKLYKGLLNRAKRGQNLQRSLDFDEPIAKEVDVIWEEARQRAETRSNTFFAQQTIKVSEVQEIVAQVKEALGSPSQVEAFVRDVLPSLNAVVAPQNGALHIDVSNTPSALRDAMGLDGQLRVTFSEPAPEGATVVHRSDPLVAGLARYVLEAALDPALKGPARRCCVVRTKDIDRRTVLLLLRLRFQLHVPTPGGTRALLVEDTALAAFRDEEGKLRQLDEPEAEALLSLLPSANIPPDVAAGLLEDVIARLPTVEKEIDAVAQGRGKALLDAHRKVREQASAWVKGLRIEHYPPDVLGVFLYVPVPKVKS